MVVRADQGEAGERGNRGKDRCHIDNPDTAGKRDYCLDENGRPAPRGSDASHILPGGGS